jgi:hypothetical protein
VNGFRVCRIDAPVSAPKDSRLTSAKGINFCGRRVFSCDRSINSRDDQSMPIAMRLLLKKNMKFFPGD